MVVTYDADRYIPIMVERIVKAFNPVKIILFGSRARGDARPDSDVDLLVVLDEIENHHRSAVAVRELLADLPIAKDIIVATPQEVGRQTQSVGSVLRPALTEGRVVHER